MVKSKERYTSKKQTEQHCRLGHGAVGFQACVSQGHAQAHEPPAQQPLRESV